MKDFIPIQRPYSPHANLGQQAVFQAQQYYNKNGLGNRIVKSASFSPDGGIHVEFEHGNQLGNEDRVSDAQQSNQALIDAAFADDPDEGPETPEPETQEPEPPAETTPDEPPAEPESKESKPDPEAAPAQADMEICQKCGKQYSKVGRGPYFYKRHVEKCEGKK